MPNLPETAEIAQIWRRSSRNKLGNVLRIPTQTPLAGIRENRQDAVPKNEGVSNGFVQELLSLNHQHATQLKIVELRRLVENHA